MSAVVRPIARKHKENAEINTLFELTNPDMNQVNHLILEKAGSNVKLIPDIARHLIDSGGKRLRPMLTIAAAQMCGYTGDHHIYLAASVEFMHTATLLHDDVVDESKQRRGKLAARKLWGNQASVLVGDFLLGQAFRMMVEVRSLTALDILSTAATIIAEGEVMQLSLAKNLKTTEDEYLAVIRAKTAALFSAAAEIGPVIAGADSSIRSAFRFYGANLGLLFQLMDDALDYGGQSAELGKNIGDDFREGKVTLPVILCYQRGTEQEQKFWKNALQFGKNDDAALKTAIQLMHKHDAIKQTIAHAHHYADIARDALGSLATSKHKKALLEVLDFCISRVH